MVFLCAVEDVNDLWETVRGNLEPRVPFKKASLNNKARNLVLVDKLFVEFVQTTDARLRRGLPGEQSILPYGFRRPYAWVILVTCDVSLLSFELHFHFFPSIVHLPKIASVISYAKLLILCQVISSGD